MQLLSLRSAQLTFALLIVAAAVVSAALVPPDSAAALAPPIPDGAISDGSAPTWRQSDAPFTPRAVTQTASSTLRLRATDDTYLSMASPNSSYGNSSTLKADGDPLEGALVRFSVPSGTSVSSATLRLYVTEPSRYPGAVHRVSGSWSESTVVSNAPGLGSHVANFPVAVEGRWLEVDVTAAVGSGSINFYLVNGNSDGVYFSSSESSNAPELVIVTRGTTGGSTPPPSATSTPRPSPSATAAPTAVPTATPSPGCTPVPSSRLSLLQNRVGFGRNTTGGASGCLYVVTNANNDGPGSLRWAAERGGYWIVFDGNYTITLDREIRVAGNTTIDGNGRQVTLRRGGLYMLGRSASNVIVANLEIRESRSGQDLLEVRNGATNFWFDHLTLQDSGDEYIDIGNSDASGTRGTISWSRFNRLSGNQYEFSILIGDDNRPQNNQFIEVTLHHNWFNGTHQRHPLITGARVHSFNNVIQWRLWGVQVRHDGSSVGAQFVSEGDIYDARYTELHRELEGVKLHDSGNRVRVTGAWLLNRAQVNQSNSSQAFSPSGVYGYSVEAANQGLLSSVTGNSGRR